MITKKERDAMSDDEWMQIDPHLKCDCGHCWWLKTIRRHWCGNDEAIKYRGTSVPGIFRCIFWKPDYDVIDKQWWSVEIYKQRHKWDMIIYEQSRSRYSKFVNHIVKYFWGK